MVWVDDGRHTTKNKGRTTQEVARTHKGIDVGTAREVRLGSASMTRTTGLAVWHPRKLSHLRGGKNRVHRLRAVLANRPRIPPRERRIVLSQLLRHDEVLVDVRRDERALDRRPAVAARALDAERRPPARGRPRECGNGRMQMQRPCLPIDGTFDIIFVVRKLVRKLTGRKESRQVKGSKT